ncbi:family 4 glycosyl hydrolase [Caldibacillus debilis]|jgi:6-phospho-beta-glucosidase|uniref:Alpha-galactosidase/6-phospho-beta-glucosidase, family 4 of glycosyl hydrolase n=1 Tax=Caldibacillus debilis GB1 TaxID=1339248 RepID=A0A420VCW7_9BACI|nr:glycoside hydrolase [Caldibacillus debilis]RKO61481.1 Alpha-galactosidase/6-phospho-beta-glucosidase, family 4 of glycosyl hydrolase [Caldibacillus debilis GB1]
MKLVVLGGGGVRSPLLAKSLVANAKSINVDEIVFMDNDPEKLRIFGGLSKFVAQAVDPDIHFWTTTDAEDAVKGAHYVITTLRVGQDESRYMDEKLAQKYDLVGQETTGVGGFAMSLRSIPALLEYCEMISKLSDPNVLIFNFTNPSGLVTQALRTAGYGNVYGICDGPPHFIRTLEQLFGVSHEEFDITCYGLNHLSFYRDAKINGRPVMDELLNHPDLYVKTDMRLFDKELVSILNHELPNEYLYFFFYNDKVIRSIKEHGGARGELIRDINKRMIAEINRLDTQDPERIFDVYIRHIVEREKSYFAIESGETRPEQFPVPTFQEFLDAPDEGGYSAVALEFIKAYHGGKKTVMPLMVPNNGAIPGLKDDDVVEITCEIEKGVCRPRKIENVPELQMHIIKTIKRFERLTVEAIHERNRLKAVEALMIHPLVNSYSLAAKLVDELLEMYKEYVGHWS